MSERKDFLNEVTPYIFVKGRHFEGWKPNPNWKGPRVSSRLLMMVEKDRRSDESTWNTSTVESVDYSSSGEDSLF